MRLGLSFDYERLKSVESYDIHMKKLTKVNCPTWDDKIESYFAVYIRFIVYWSVIAPPVAKIIMMS